MAINSTLHEFGKFSDKSSDLQAHRLVHGNQGLSTHKATESSTTAAWTGTSDFEMAAVENVN